MVDDDEVDVTGVLNRKVRLGMRRRRSVLD